MTEFINKIVFRERSGKAISKIVYGTIVVTALIVTLEEYSTDAWSIMASIFGTMLVIGLAESYSGIVGSRIEKKGQLASHETKDKLTEGAIIFATSQIPMLIFLFSAVNILSLNTAFLLAKIFALFLLFIYGLLYGLLSGRKFRTSVIIGLTDGGFGVLLIALKAFIH